MNNTDKMESISRQTTTQSNHSLFIVALDQNGPMVSHTMETISYHDDNNDDQIQKYEINHSHPTLEKSNTIHSENTIPPSTSLDKTSVHNKSSNNENTSLQPWKFWKEGSGSVDPKSLSKTKKNLILSIVAIAGCSSPLASTIYLPALVNMQIAFNTDDTTMNASIAIFTFFTAFFPLLWAAAGERIGRRKVYIASFIITVIGSICCALSVNVTMLIVFRAISAIGSSSTMSMGAGTLSDIFEIHERGRAFSWYICGPLLGPALGPIIGGLLNNGLGFRSIFYFLAIVNFFILLNIFFFLPDTDTARRKQNQKKQSKSFNPFSAMDLFLNKNIALCVAFLGVLFFSLYLVNANFSRSYATVYGFESSIVGVCYLPNAVGCAIGGIAGGRLSDKRYIRNANQLKKSQINHQDSNEEFHLEKTASNKTSSDKEIKYQQQPYPEMRIGGFAFYGAIVLQLLAITCYGWLIQYKIHFAFGLVCQFFYGMGLMMPNIVLSTYMVDCFRTRGASVTACNNFTRYIMAGVGSLVSSDFESAIGAGPLNTFIGVILTLFAINLIFIQLKGNTWRLEKMKKQQEKGLKIDTNT
ncbi:unnamed protein product [Cunninghamella blakesleeana]